MLRQLIDRLSRPKPTDVLWKPCAPPMFPVGLIDGRKSRQHGQLWRRFRNGRWEYRQDEESEEDVLDRQW